MQGGFGVQRMDIILLHNTRRLAIGNNVYAQPT